MHRINNRDRADAAAQLVGWIFLDMAASKAKKSLPIQGPVVRNTGLVMALFIRFASEMRQRGLLRREKELFKNSSRFDDFIRELATVHDVRFDRVGGLEPLPSPVDLSAEDQGGYESGLFPELANYYAKSWGSRPCQYPDLAIGGDSCDITTWSSTERKGHSISGRDPLNQVDIESLKLGNTMQVM